MRRTIVVLLGVLCIVGCAESRTGTPVESPPVAGVSSVPPEAQDVFPGVPRHPGVGTQKLSTAKRAYIRVPDKAAAEVLSWYWANLSNLGWTAVPSTLPADSALLVTKEGQYLSLSGHDVPGGNAVVWFHLRSTPEVTEDEAIAIAGDTDHSPVQWTASYISEFESDHTDGKKHPVWVVKGQQEGTVRVVANVDALTAEPFQVKTIN